MKSSSLLPLRWLPALALALVALSGCATSDGLAAGTVAPEFAVDGWVNTRAGTTNSVSGNRGKHLLVEFFSMHCPFCRDRIPEMQEITRTYRSDELEVLSVHVPLGNHDDTAESIAAFAQKTQLPFPVAVDLMGNTLTHFQFGYLPHACLIGPDGRVVWAGPMSADDLGDRVRAALGGGEAGTVAVARVALSSPGCSSPAACPSTRIGTSIVPGGQSPR